MHLRHLSFLPLLAPALHAQGSAFVEPMPGQIIVNGVPSTSLVRVWNRPCTTLGPCDDATFHRAIAIAKQAEAAAPHVTPQQQNNQAQLGSFDLHLNATGSMPGSPGALASVELYFDSSLSSSHSSASAEIVVQFAALPPGLGLMTAVQMGQLPYAGMRAFWINNRDADDVVQKYLPASTLPVRFDASSPSVTQCDQVYIPYPVIAGTISNVNGLTTTHATITVNTNYPWDFEPGDGIAPNSACFQTALAHELGHCLGFASNIELGTPTAMQLDAYRFQRSNGNPSSYAEFSTLPRLVDHDAPNDDHELDFVAFEIAMEDGSPSIASHLRAQTPRQGLMDPESVAGTTSWPNFLSTSDLRVLDAIGFDWDDPTLDAVAHVTGVVRNDENPNSATLVRWRAEFDQRVGPVTLSDFSISGLAGAAALTVTPVKGSAVHLDGTNWMDLGDDLSIVDGRTNPFTIECWIRPSVQSSSGAPKRMIVALGEPTAGGAVNVFLDTNNRVGVDFGGAPLAWTSPIVNDGEWHHVALQSTGGSPASVTLRVDGVASGSNVVTLDLAGGHGFAGRTLVSAAPVDGFRGDLDELRFHGRVVPLGELLSNSDEALPVWTAELLGCYPFDELAPAAHGNPTFPDSPDESIHGGWCEARAAGAVFPTLVPGRVDGARAFLLEAATGSNSGNLTATFSDDDSVLTLRTREPLNGTGTGTTTGQTYQIQHAVGFSYCEGLSCPCENDTPLGTNVGCLSSLGVGGKLRASGSTSVGAGNLTLVGSQMPNATALYVAGSAQTNTPVGDGNFCLGGTIVRLGSKLNAAGASQFPDVGQASIATRLGAVAGQTSYFQIWYRNAASFCTPETFNDSNAWRLTWTP